MEAKYLLILTTLENFLSAHQISKVLITEQLAACCTIVPNCFSVYTWEGKVEERKECLLFIKTTEDKYKQLEQRLRELHSDKVPEIIALPIVSGLEDYLSWIQDVVK
ncbi:MAG: divalent-cation tolerance protein CutA [Candidatus Kapaibacteriota bacterium]